LAVGQRRIWCERERGASLGARVGGCPPPEGLVGAPPSGLSVTHHLVSLGGSWRAPPGHPPPGGACAAVAVAGGAAVAAVVAVAVPGARKRRRRRRRRMGPARTRPRPPARPGSFVGSNQGRPWETRPPGPRATFIVVMGWGSAFFPRCVSFAARRIPSDPANQQWGGQGLLTTGTPAGGRPGHPRPARRSGGGGSGGAHHRRALKEEGYGGSTHSPAAPSSEGVRSRWGIWRAARGLHRQRFLGAWTLIRPPPLPALY